MQKHKIRYIKNYLSINNFEEIFIPEFTIITGLNGSGKSHLLKAFKEGCLKFDDIESNDINYYDFNTLYPQNSNALISNGVDAIHSQIWQELKNAILQENFQKRELIDFLHIHNIPDEFISNEIIVAPEYRNTLVHVGAPAPQNLLPQYTQMINTIYSNNMTPINYAICSSISKRLNCLIIDLKEDDIKFAPEVIRAFDDNNLFGQKLTQIFSFYKNLQIDNNFNNFLNKKYNESKTVLTDQEFKDRFGPEPWTLVNEIFEKNSLDFIVNKPSNERNFTFEAKLSKKSINKEIPFSNLSSGEKILISFALCIYNTNNEIFINENNIKLFLFDEIDALLHPSMTKAIIHIMNDIFVKRLGIKVIAVTHSPTTVALAPDDSIYVMEGGKLEKSTKSKALNILTDGIPTVAISFDGRRQVFVESENDKFIYSTIYEIYKKQINIDRSLEFMSTGVKNKQGTDVNTGCFVVKKLVKVLNGNGVKSVYGLIDYDKKK